MSYRSASTGRHKLAKPVEQRLHTRTEAALVVPASPHKPNLARTLYKRSQQRAQSRSAGWKRKERERGYERACLFTDHLGAGHVPAIIAHALHSDHKIPHSDLQKMTAAEALELLKRIQQDPKHAGVLEHHKRVMRERRETRESKESPK